MRSGFDLPLKLLQQERLLLHGSLQMPLLHLPVTANIFRYRSDGNGLAQILHGELVEQTRHRLLVLPAQRPLGLALFAVAEDIQARATQKKLATPFGELLTWRVVKSPPPDCKGQQVELWLAPGVEWYPARIRYTDHDGDYIEQSLATVTKKVP